MATSKEEFPDVPPLLKRELERVRREHKRTQNAIADALGISTGSFSDMVNGHTQFPEMLVKDLVKQLESKRPGELEKQLRKAITSSKPHYDTVLKRLRAGLDLSISTIDYFPFAGGGVMETIFSHFSALAGIKCGAPDNRKGLSLADYQNSDVSLGLFDSADRMLNLDFKFWRVPIRMGLGAVCHVRDAEHADIIAHTLSRNTRSNTVNLRPIVAANDVGALHCHKRLGFSKESLIEVKSIDVAELAARLLHEAQENGDLFIPVICTDEYTCLKIVKHLNGSGVPVFPLNSWRAGKIRSGRSRQELPQYYCSIATSRSDRVFQEFMQDALVHFLSTEIETTALSWSNLAINLVGLLTEMPLDLMPETVSPNRSLRLRGAQTMVLIWEWIFYTLSLDLISIETFSSFNPLPWKPVLRRARELVQAHIAKEMEPMLRDLVDCFWEATSGKDRLCEALDIKLGAELRALPKPYVVSVLQGALEGSQTPPISVELYDPTKLQEGSRACLAMRTFMRSLQSLYDECACADAVAHIGRDVEGLANGDTPYKAESGRILLAQLKNKRQGAFVGGACIQLRPNNMCEVRYLWVMPHYRGGNVGKQIISKAIWGASELFQCVDIYVEILDKLLPTATALFDEMGFRKSDMIPSAPGRVVLTRPTSDPLVAEKSSAAFN